MSYDLVVFDPEIAPRDNADFMGWYRELTMWKEPRDYNSPQGMSGNLPQFFHSMRNEFPPMNGPFAFDLTARRQVPVLSSLVSFFKKLLGQKPAPAHLRVFNEANVTDYTLASHAVYMAFAYSVIEDAHYKVMKAAFAHNLGFFDASGGNGMILRSIDDFHDFIGL